MNLVEWMCPKHCLPDAWVRYVLLVGGLLIGLFYFFFSYLVFTKVKGVFRTYVEPNFAYYLGCVFIFCGLAHSLHGLKYVNQYFQIGLIMVYPFLIYFHSMLLISTIRSYKKYSKKKYEIYI